MAINLFGEDLKRVLKRLLEACGLTAHRLAELSEVDRAYLHRLLSGEKKNPSIKTVLELFLGLSRSQKPPTLAELDELLKAGGHPPLFADGDADRAA